MISRNIILQVGLYAVILIVGIAVGPLLVDSVSGIAHSKMDSTLVQEEAAPDAVHATATCTIGGVAAYDNRIHVRCYEKFAPGSAISFFAAPTSDPQRAARLLSVLLTAHAADKRVNVVYDTADSGAAFGCLVSDCRPIQALSTVD